MKKYAFYITLGMAIISTRVQAQTFQCYNLFQKSFIDLRGRSIQSEQDHKMIIIEIASLKPEFAREQLIKNISETMDEEWIELDKLIQISISDENSNYIVFEAIKKEGETIIFNVKKPKNMIKSNDLISQGIESIIIDREITREIDQVKIQELPSHIIEEKIKDLLRLLSTKTGQRLNEQEVKGLAIEILKNNSIKSEQILGDFNVGRVAKNNVQMTNNAIARFIYIYPDINPLLVSKAVEIFFKKNLAAKTIIDIEFSQTELDVLSAYNKYLTIKALDQTGQIIQVQQSINIGIQGEILE